MSLDNFIEAVIDKGLISEQMIYEFIECDENGVIEKSNEISKNINNI